MGGAKEIETFIVDAVRLVGEQLPTVDRDGIISLAQAREWGIALENLCTQIYEYDIAISPDLYQRISVVAKSMGLDQSYWEVLRPLIKDSE